MKLKGFCLLLIAALAVTGCKSTKEVKETEEATSMETAVPTQLTAEVDQTPIPEEIPENEPFDYSDASEVFISAPEEEYIPIDSDDYITLDADSYIDEDLGGNINGIDFSQNDYSDDYAYEYESTQTAPTQFADTTQTAQNTQPQQTQTTQAEPQTHNNGGTYVSPGSFYIDYTSDTYSDYSGYNYGDADYDKLIAKFGPNSFPSDKIMARGRKTATQLYNYFVSKNPQGNLARARELAELYIEECSIEGVNSDLAFVQMCHETGFLRFGNLVTPDMNNFCGLGAVSKANPGLRFETARMGVRAHVQHLHAYGSTVALKQTLVDPRYKYVLPRGKAPTLAGLTGTWAVDKNYDKKIYSFMKELAHF